jgi:hypothetical protein
MLQQTQFPFDSSNIKRENRLLLGTIIIFTLVGGAIFYSIQNTSKNEKKGN